MDTDAIDRVVRSIVDDGYAPGAVAIVADRDRVLFSGASGFRNSETRQPMTIDTIFRIASMTKTVNAIAVLQLMEAGGLRLDTPVGDILPEFDEVQVIDGWDGETPRLRAPGTRVTMRHLLTHTSGLTYDALNAEAFRYVAATGVPMPSSGRLATFASPMVVEPGTAWTYGMSADWTGRVVEAVSGLSLEEYYRRHILEPLGMPDTTFTLRDTQRARLAPVHARQIDGSFAPIDFEWVEDPEFLSAGHGLYSTAADFVRVQQLLLREGELDGTRLLAAESVRLMYTDHLSPLTIEPMPSTIPAFSDYMDLGPGLSWGLDALLTVEQRPGMRAVGSAGWCGTFNTIYWVDRASGLTAALYLQTLPFWEPGALAAFESFERAVYRSAGAPTRTMFLLDESKSGRMK